MLAFCFIQEYIMESTINQYVHVGLGVILATVTLIIIMQCFALRREAQVVMENKDFYEKQYDYKSHFDGLNVGDKEAMEILSIVTEYAETLDIYIDKLSDPYGSYGLIIDYTNRQFLNKINLTSGTMNSNKFGWATATPAFTNAQKYGLTSAAALGKVIFGTNKWQVTFIYDNGDVTAAPPAGYTPSNGSTITGLRIIRK